MSPEQVLVQVPANETPKERRQREKIEREEQKLADQQAKQARYAQLRANVGRRRAAYVLLILIDIAVLIATALDIVFNDSDLMWPLLAAYVVLFIIGILLLFSQRKALEDVNVIRAVQRTWLECDNCRSVFQFGSESLASRRRIGFTCPVCGDESALPLPGTAPVERAIPAGRLEESNYLCGNCKEDIVVGVYGGRPRDVDFRACPKCGETGQIRPNSLTA